MWSIFNRKPRFHDQALVDLAAMLTEDVDNPVPGRELLDAKKLDYSIESLKHLDEYLDLMRADPPAGDDLLKLVLRSGAYVGEVIRRHSPVELHWIDHEAAAKEAEILRDQEPSLATAAVLWAEPGTLYLPLLKVCKYLENGAEDGVQVFAQAVLDIG